jgi:hypothetical protein
MPEYISLARGSSGQFEIKKFKYIRDWETRIFELVGRISFFNLLLTALIDRLLVSQPWQTIFSYSTLW